MIYNEEKVVITDVPPDLRKYWEMPPWEPRSVSKQYNCDKLIGGGTYGMVFKGQKKNSQNIQIAQKKQEYDKSGISIIELREIQQLRTIQHPNIIRLIDVVTSHKLHTQEKPMNISREKQLISDIDTINGHMYFVYEYCDMDLERYRRNVEFINIEHVRYIIHSILLGLKYCHEHNIMHRDLKTANILITKDGQIKIADFGLARSTCTNVQYTPEVTTLWYRAPEVLLMGTRNQINDLTQRRVINTTRTTNNNVVPFINYDMMIDIWSVGCILIELLRGSAPFPHSTELQQLLYIFSVCGVPTEETWPCIISYPLYPAIKDLLPQIIVKRTFHEYLRQILPPSIPTTTFDFIEGLLKINPIERFDVTTALKNSYFKNPPMINKETFSQEIKWLFISNLQLHSFHCIDNTNNANNTNITNTSRNSKVSSIKNTYTSIQLDRKDKQLQDIKSTNIVSSKSYTTQYSLEENTEKLRSTIQDIIDKAAVLGYTLTPIPQNYTLQQLKKLQPIYIQWKSTIIDDNNKRRRMS